MLLYLRGELIRGASLARMDNNLIATMPQCLLPRDFPHSIHSKHPCLLSCQSRRLDEVTETHFEIPVFDLALSCSPLSHHSYAVEDYVMQVRGILMPYTPVRAVGKIATSSRCRLTFGGLPATDTVDNSTRLLTW